MRHYCYVGPAAIRERHAGETPAGVRIDSAADMLSWLRARGTQLARGEVIVTFVVNCAGELLIADRHSEHVACAGGQAVLSAGELTFVESRPIPLLRASPGSAKPEQARPRLGIGSTVAIEGNAVQVIGVSNQSTGYCPEPESWPAVEAALTRAGLAAPDGFVLACVFRKCVACGEKSIVKNHVFECLLCGADLPAEYNCQSDCH
jgi:hypothetical protein